MRHVFHPSVVARRPRQLLLALGVAFACAAPAWAGEGCAAHAPDDAQALRRLREEPPAESTGVPLIVEFARCGYVGSIGYLIEHRLAPVDAAAPDGDTSLVVAAGQGNAALVDRLLAAGADVNRRGASGMTPLIRAVAGHAPPSVVDSLLAAGADPNAAADSGRTAVFWTIGDALDGVAGGWLSGAPAARRTMDLLLAHGADLLVRDQRGRGLMHEAAERSVSGAAVSYLVQKGLGVISPDRDGVVPLHLARSPAAVARLVAQGADVEAADAEGRRPLHWAATKSQNVAAALLEAGAGLNSRDRRGRTPLHEAVQAGASGIVELLVSRGADASARDQEGETPLQMAMRVDRGDLLALLRGVVPKVRDPGFKTAIGRDRPRGRRFHQ